MNRNQNQGEQARAQNELENIQVSTGNQAQGGSETDASRENARKLQEAAGGYSLQNADRQTEAERRAEEGARFVRHDERGNRSDLQMSPQDQQKLQSTIKDLQALVVKLQDMQKGFQS